MTVPWSGFVPLGLIATLCVAVAAGGCSAQTRHRVLSVLFEGVPPLGETQEPEPVVNQPRRPAPKPLQSSPLKPVVAVSVPELQRPRPPDWRTLLWTLPRDETDAVDWVLALEGGFISPKSGLEAGAEERPFFDYDVKLVQEGWELFSVTFPHGSHTRWLGCDNCHPQIFEMRQGAAPITMDAIGAGEYCGRCHGAVAFPVPTGCPRCHRQTGEDVGSILSALVSATQTGRTPSVRTAVNVRGTIVFERSERQQDFPPATFPHWVHRIQFRCDVCHTRIFPMQAGASRITMDAILQGKLCGTCHNGTTAFPARFDTCYRCHTQP